MTVDKNCLLLTKKEFIELLNDNRDNSKENDYFKNCLLSIIERKYITPKQHDWILSKIKYITNTNMKYKIFKKRFDDFYFVS
jgi:hypothetical protein